MVGLTAIEVLVELVFQVYVVAPFAVKVVVFPKQIVDVPLIEKQVKDLQ